MDKETVLIITSAMETIAAEKGLEDTQYQCYKNFGGTLSREEFQKRIWLICDETRGDKWQR